MEMTLTSSILLFNQRVTKQIDQLEMSVMYEVSGLQTELQKEEKRRVNNDQLLLGQVNEFLVNLQQPNAYISPIKAKKIDQNDEEMDEQEASLQGGQNVLEI